MKENEYDDWSNVYYDWRDGTNEYKKQLKRKKKQDRRELRLSSFLRINYSLYMKRRCLTMIKTLKEDYVKIHDGIDDVLMDTVLWPVWYFIKGHIEGCVIVYWFFIITALITKKKWSLVERDH